VALFAPQCTFIIAPGQPEGTILAGMKRISKIAIGIAQKAGGPYETKMHQDEMVS
jgi:hypothetical protein